MSFTQYPEEIQAKYETDETPESHLLLVHIPDGFAREHIRAKIEYDFGKVRVSGERPLAKNRKASFNVEHKVPEYCDINRIRGKFDGKTVTITMQKDPEKVLKQKPQPSEQEETEPQPSEQEETEPQPNEQEETEPKPENEQEGTPESETMNDYYYDDDDDQEKTTNGDDHVPKSTIGSKEEVGHDTPPTSPRATEEPTSQEGKDGISDEGVESTELPKGATPPLSPRDESEEQAGYETSNPPEGTEETMPQKGKEGISQKATNYTTDAKLQTEENFVQRDAGKEESDDHPKKTLETRKSLEERKGIATVESISTKGIEKEKENEINDKVIGNDVAEKKSDEKGKPESTTRTRIKEVAASASQAVTTLAKRFNEEDKQKLIYMGAAVIVVALGVYATYKLRSSRRL
ncbi:hypothetical protein VNO77_25867 [Canavalia gladiata]|uniref:SHSP domain-containing protein n=1 Tax=Canavalia gladiata TaxID=3824 RepID=A0AAN9KSS3_CANGL